MDFKDIKKQLTNISLDPNSKMDYPLKKIPEKSFTKNQFIAWGKMGGRPKKEKKLSERITIRFYPEEFEILKAKSVEKNINLTDYCRIVLNETQIPNAKQNKLLISYAHNFTLISNYMKKRIFSEQDKEDLLREINLLVLELRKQIKW